MQALRQAPSIARWVLLWFALSLGVAMASPLVQPQDLRLVCSASGAIKTISLNADGQASGNSNGGNPSLDCPLCIGWGAPPPMAYCGGVLATPRGYALPWQAQAGYAPARAALPPARAPPAHA